MAKLSPKPWAGLARDWDRMDCWELAVRYLGQPDQKAGRAGLELMPADVAWLARILKVVQHEDG